MSPQQLKSIIYPWFESIDVDLHNGYIILPPRVSKKLFVVWDNTNTISIAAETWQTPSISRYDPIVSLCFKDIDIEDPQFDPGKFFEPFKKVIEHHETE